MKIFIPLTVVAALTITACSNPPHEGVDARSAAPWPSVPLVYRYRCQSGETIVATYPTTDTATVRYKGRIYDMRIAISGSGARYVGNALVWWTKGPEGTLFHHDTDGPSGDAIEVCAQS